MSLWLFIFLCLCAVLPIWIGSAIIDSKKKSIFNIILGWIFVLVGLSIIGYSVYKYFIFDYSKSIDKAIVNHDYAKAHELLLDMSQISSETKDHDFWTPEQKYKSKYTIAAEKVFKSELTYLLNQGDRESSDRLISLIGDLPIEATPTIGITDNKETQKRNDAYSVYVGKFNGICDDVLHNAISTGNKYLAEKMLTLYKPTLVRVLEESHIFSTDAYRYTYSNEMQIEARKRFDEAVRAKAFSQE